jgi:hypothetical protein
MKTSKIFFLTLAMSFFVITSFLVSCNKENDLSQPEKAYSLKTGIEPEMRTLYEMPDPPGALECDYPTGNCLPTTTIKPKDYKSTSNLRLIYADFISKYNSNRISDFFQNSSDYLALFPALANMPDVVYGLQNSEIVLYHQTSSFDGFDYYIGLKKGTDFSSKWMGDQKCVFVINNQLE